MKTILIYLGSESFTDRETGEVKYIHHFGDDIVGGNGIRPFGKCISTSPIGNHVPFDEVQVDVALFKNYQKITLLN